MSMKKKYEVYISYTTYVRGVYEAESEEDAVQMCREDESLNTEILCNLQECDYETIEK